MVVEYTEQSIQFDMQQLPARLYRDGATPRSAPLVFHLHGGGFIDGSLESGRTVATILAEAGAIVLSADYPLAPAAQFPKQLDVSYGALTAVCASQAQWASRKSGLYVAGEEAGGNLAASLALMARDQGRPSLAGQILLSPMLDPCMGTKSARDGHVGPAGCRLADGWRDYLGTADKACHPYATPLGVSRLRNIAPALIVTAEDDPLRNECYAYAACLNKADIPVQTQMLAAPTGWPGALAHFTGTDAPWLSMLRNRLVGFFSRQASLQKGPPHQF